MKVPKGWDDVLRLLRLPLPERRFVMLGIVAIVIIRLAVILVTPRTADFLDPRIYQGAGQTVLAGVNPYDYSDKPAQREALRAKMSTSPKPDDFTATQKSWDYYVSGNLPVSTALYALFETVAHGSRFVWRLLLILGDIALFLGLFALIRTLRGGMQYAADQAAIVLLAIVNPILIASGCAIPEDKQFQTALLFWVAALLLSPAATTVRRGLCIGFALSLSILFKLLGVFLIPMWVSRARREWPGLAIWSVIAGLVPLIASFVVFGHYFLDSIAARGIQNSIVGPEHASPWVLLPWHGETEFLYGKVAVVSMFCATIGVLLLKRRIDLLNFCAGLVVAFVCLWLDKGAMNRMNIGIVFAVGALASLRGNLFLVLSAAIALVGGIGYAVGIALLRLPISTVDATLTLLFVSGYLAVLVVFSGPRLESNSRPGPLDSMAAD